MAVARTQEMWLNPKEDIRVEITIDWNNREYEYNLVRNPYNRGMFGFWNTPRIFIRVKEIFEGSPNGRA